MKQVLKTDRVKAQLAASIGDPAADTEGLAVFEAVAVNTMPLLRRTGLHASARIGPDILAAMVLKANEPGGRTIPLKIMHRDGGLPVGKVFTAQMKPRADGHTDLHAMFYLSKKESDLVSKIDTGVVGEVSVSIKPTNLLCSDCGWNYNGTDSTFENIWDCTCPNEHTIGTNGTHLKLHGLDDWSELSLVDRGAADGAKILARPKMVMGDPARLAARGFDENVFSLFASASDTTTTTTPKKEEISSMDYTEKFVALSATHAVAEHELTALKASAATTAAELVTLKAANVDLTANLAAAVATDGVKAATEVVAANTFLTEMLTASFAATGKTGTAIPELISEKVVLLREARAGLALVIPAKGVTEPAGKGNPAATPANHAAFKRS